MSDNKELGAGPLANEGTKGLPVVAEPCIECWSCHVPVTLNERAECDGECPHCASELDLDDYLGTAVMALAELRQSIEGTTGYKYRAELYDEVWQAARDRGFANVVGALAALDALQAELAAMRDQKPVAWIREPDADGMALDWYPGDLTGLPIGTKLYAGPFSAPCQVAAEVVQANREKARDAVAAVLGDAMDCTRVWSAWRVGTMSEHDFSVIAEDEDRLYEIVDAALLATSQGEA